MINRIDNKPGINDMTRVVSIIDKVEETTKETVLGIKIQILYFLSCKSRQRAKSGHAVVCSIINFLQFNYRVQLLM